MAVEPWSIRFSTDYSRASSLGTTLRKEPDSPSYEGKRDKSPHEKTVQSHNKSKHDLPIAADLVGRNFTAASSNKLWVSDITYVWTWEGWLYLACVMDVFNRQIVGWTLHNRLTKDLVVNALGKAILESDPQQGLIFHSDRGSQYASHEVRRILKARGIRQSMCGKGNCYDNAMIESFFSSLKKELVRLETFHSKEQAWRSIFEYIEIFYNRQRRHSSLYYRTPVEYYREAAQT